jgi:hypothetical protein
MREIISNELCPRCGKLWKRIEKGQYSECSKDCDMLYSVDSDVYYWFLPSGGTLAWFRDRCVYLSDRRFTAAPLRLWPRKLPLEHMTTLPLLPFNITEERLRLLITFS